MSILSRFRRRKNPYEAVTDEERIARYVYLLGSLPASVIESAHASAFADVPAAQRRAMFEQLRPFLAESERDAASDDPAVLARLLRRAEERRARRQATDASAGVAVTTAVRPEEREEERVEPPDRVDVVTMLRDSGVLTIVAAHVIVSSAVTSFYTVGAGSLMIGSEPGWVGETYDIGSAGFGGSDFGGSDFGGGGFDGGGSGIDQGTGGFDMGGFGGGFDGGGG